jgi:hypothetical protein
LNRKHEEIEYCQTVLNPLFETMIHYIENLRYRHGNTEFGKDFTFSYINPLNQRVNVGIQVKWGDIVGSSTGLVNEIVSQIQVAFAVPYKNKPNDPELYLNELYVVCSGKYTDNAITIIEKTLEKNFNVFFLDGSEIEHLRSKFAQRKGIEKTETRRALNALLIELEQNINIARAIDSQMEEYIRKKMHFLTDFRLNCLQRVLELDIDDEWILDEAVIQWTNLTIDNNLLIQIRLALVDEDAMKNRKLSLWNNIKKDIGGLENLRNHVRSYVESAGAT